MSEERTRGTAPPWNRNGNLRLHSERGSGRHTLGPDDALTLAPEPDPGDPQGEQRFRARVSEAVEGGDFTGAQTAIGNALRTRRYGDTAWHLLGVVRLCLGDTQSARDCLAQALRLREGAGDRGRRVSTHTALARVEMCESQYEAAWGHLDGALSLEPFSLQLHWNRLCLACAHFGHCGQGDPQARERLEAARAALANIDPTWLDQGAVDAPGPFLISLK